MSEVFREKLTSNLIGGALLYASDVLVPNAVKLALYPQVVKPLKQFADPVLKAGIGIVLPLIPQIRDSMYAQRYAELSFMAGIKDVIHTFVDKPALVVAEDASTLHGYNFNDTTKLVIFIDGTQVASNAYTISGSASDFTVKLSTALSSGEHDIMVADNKVAFYGKVRV